MDHLTELKKNRDLAWAQNYRKEVREEYTHGAVSGLLLGVVIGILITITFLTPV